MKFVIDSSVFVCAMREQEKDSKICFQILQKLERAELSTIIPVTVLIEVAAAIGRRTDNKILAERVAERLLSFRALQMIDLTFLRAKQYLALTCQLRLAGMDAIVVGTAAEFQLPLLTLDKEIQKRAKDFIEIISIQDAI